MESWLSLSTGVDAFYRNRNADIFQEKKMAMKNYSCPRHTAYNKRVSGSGFQPSPKSPLATSDTRQPLGEISDILGLKRIFK